jgi:predicted AAA+ superfamily ATPase
MFERKINNYFNAWKVKKGRKPLIIRGARQVGKTSAVKEFAKNNFETFIYLNLERIEDAEIFSEKMPIKNLIEIIQLKKNLRLVPGRTLLFIDEIQNSGIATSALRYFYEEYPDLHIMAAGSLLEARMKKEGFSFPVGRVEFCYMFPVDFEEFLLALNENAVIQHIFSAEQLSDIPDVTHNHFLGKYYEYLAVGGMPEAVAKYAETRSFIDVNSIYDSIFTGYLDDAGKYSSEVKAGYIRHIIEHSPENAGLAVKYEGFGGSAFRSREMSEAFDLLENAMVIRRINASSSLQAPIIHNFKKSPKLVFLDTGLLNYRLNIRADLLKMPELDSLFQGRIAEQAVGQALISNYGNPVSRLAYWYRDKPGASAEVDYLLQQDTALIPVEVKAGKAGKLRSLHVFMEHSNCKLAFRIHSGKTYIQDIALPSGKKYKLVSLPFYLLHRIQDFIKLSEA